MALLVSRIPPLSALRRQRINLILVDVFHFVGNYFDRNNHYSIWNNSFMHNSHQFNLEPDLLAAYL